MAGALAERDFVAKLEKSGFTDVEVVDRQPWGVGDCALYPLFDDDLVALMNRVIPAEQQAHIGDTIVITAHL